VKKVMRRDKMNENKRITASTVIDKIMEPAWVKMKQDSLPLFIFGCGALKDNIYNYLNKYEIKAEGWYVNTEIEQDTIYGMKVYSQEELTEQYSEFSVIIGHSHYEQGIAFLKTLKGCKNIYYLTSLCYDRFDNISEDFLVDNEEAINDIYEMCEDDLSKKSFLSYLEARANNKADYMFPYFEEGCGYWNNDVVTLGEHEVYLDVGAYVGTSIWNFADATDGKYDKILAFEPDVEAVEIIKEELEKRNLSNVILRQECIYNKNGKAKFVRGDEEEGAIIENAKNYIEVDAVTVDCLCEELGIDISVIKMNFPFSVNEVLEGAQGLLARRKPKIIIRIGFHEEQLISATLLIKKLNPEYKIYFRYTVGIPQGITLFAV
jgi:FkbM family methyltransferase